MTSLVLKHCVHALRQPRGYYFNYVEVLKCHVEVLKCHVEVVKCHVGVLRCHAKTCHDVDMGFLQNRMLGAGTCMLASVTCMLRITAPFPDVRHGMSSEHINTEALRFSIQYSVIVHPW